MVPVGLLGLLEANKQYSADKTPTAVGIQPSFPDMLSDARTLWGQQASNQSTMLASDRLSAPPPFTR